MSGKKPRKPKAVAFNTFERAVMGARKLDPIHRTNIADMIRRGWDQLKSGDPHSQAFADLCYASNVAAELSSIGICSDEVSVLKTKAAQEVLTRLAGFHEDWTKLVMSDGDEFTMEEAIFIWIVQLEYCSLSEFEKARHRVNVAMEDAKRGVVAKATTVIKFTQETK